MRTGLYQVYWRCVKDDPSNSHCVPSAFKWELIAAFVAPEDAVLWIKYELNHNISGFECKTMYKGRNYTYKDGD